MQTQRNDHHGFTIIGTSNDNIFSAVTPPIAEDSDSEDAGEWRAIREPIPAPAELIFNAPFAIHEHNRLMGAVCFTEDMSDEERDEHWETLAYGSQRHSAEEWKKYYEHVIRPAHLQKVDRKETLSALASQTNDPGVDGVEDVAEIAEVVVDDAEGLRASMWAPKAEDAQFPKCAATQDATEAPAASKNEVKSDLHPHNRYDALASNRLSDIGQVQHLEGYLASDDQRPGDFETKSEQKRTIFAASPPYLSESHEIAPNEFPSEPANTLSRTPDSDESLYSLRTRPLVPNNSASFRRSPRLYSYPRGVSRILHNFDSTDEGMFHTVLISNIPSDNTLFDILSNVRGGKIVSATFLKTAGMKMKPPIETNGVMIVFLEAWQAKTFLNFCAVNRLSLWSMKRSLPAEADVKLLKTPTCPPNRELVYAARNGDLTRVLFVIDDQHLWTSGEVVEQMVRYNRASSDSNKRLLQRPLTSGRDNDGILVFEFSDVRDAALAWYIIDADGDFFDGASKGYLPDPCDRSLSTLQDRGVDTAPKGGEGTADGQEEKLEKIESSDTAIETPSAVASFDSDAEVEKSERSVGRE